ncbi:hypothetical protein [Streptomyces indicus]|uniref:Uncharacterized protein n=1 Tax=Streptomyces indicus TaxID=417292 RepID=A0A1G8UDS8_9ACTN|nr:hypothetical protein [Streptomyces indicus]SDJ51882.1 hypothetical protein SAMN05421806_101791 [Streptomyces indicus]
MRRLTRFATAAGLATASALVSWPFFSQGDTHAEAKPAGRDVVVSHGEDRRPNHTAADWVTYAEHVVVVKVTAERELPASQEELAAGEGYLPRQVDLAVQKVLWSSEKSTTQVPASFPWLADGWSFHGTERTPMVMEGTPRMEVGHTYVMAVEWQPGISEGGDEIPGQWRGLGSGSTIPYDDGVLGQGESEGEILSPAQTLAAAETGPDGLSLEDSLTGKDTSALVSALNSAEPLPAEDFGR